ncbi:hypothetical protein NBRC116586_27390 [Pseudooceanicola nitratireducens]
MEAETRYTRKILDFVPSTCSDMYGVYRSFSPSQLGEDPLTLRSVPAVEVIQQEWAHLFCDAEFSIGSL